MGRDASDSKWEVKTQISDFCINNNHGKKGEAWMGHDVSSQYQQYMKNHYGMGLMSGTTGDGFGTDNTVSGRFFLVARYFYRHAKPRF